MKKILRETVASEGVLEDVFMPNLILWGSARARRARLLEGRLQHSSLFLCTKMDNCNSSDDIQLTIYKFKNLLSYEWLRFIPK